MTSVDGAGTLPLPESESLEQNNPKVSDNQLIDQFENSLKGTCILEKPRVSKKVMVDSLRGQNKVISNLLKEMKRIDVLEEEKKTMKGRIEDLEHKTIEQADELNLAHTKITSLENVVNTFKHKVNMFDEMVATIKQLNEEFNAIREDNTKQQDVNQNVAGFMEEDKKFKSVLCSQVQDIETEVRDMPKTIQIEAKQVLVDKKNSKREGSKDMNLKDWCTESKTNRGQHDYDIDNLKKTVESHADSLNNKAGKVYEGIVEANKISSGQIQDKLEANDAVDLVALRSNLDTNIEAVDEIRMDMMAKINSKEVDAKIEERYEEIVDHLSKALKTVDDDETEFKKSTNDVHEALNALKLNKADRGELEHVKDRVEEMVLEGGQTDPKIFESLQSRVTKEEMAQMLEDKVNKDELTYAIEDLTKILNTFSNKFSKAEPGSKNDRNLVKGLSKILKVDDRRRSSTNSTSRGGGGKGGSNNQREESQQQQSFLGQMFGGKRQSVSAGGVAGEKSRNTGFSYRTRSGGGVGQGNLDEECDIGINTLLPQFANDPLAIATSLSKPKGRNNSNSRGSVTKVCLACHTVVPNFPQSKMVAEGAKGGGFQVFTNHVDKVGKIPIDQSNIQEAYKEQQRKSQQEEEKIRNSAKDEGGPEARIEHGSGPPLRTGTDIVIDEKQNEINIVSL